MFHVSTPSIPHASLFATCALLLALPATPLAAQSNLLVNGGFEDNNGFVVNQTGFDGYTFAPIGEGTFRGFVGFDTDVQDDNFANGTYTGTTAGGSQFGNVFPSATGAPALLGESSALVLGEFFPNPGFSGLFQQVAVTPGDVVASNLFAISDPTILQSSSGRPDTIFELGTSNRVFTVLEFFDGVSTNRMQIDANGQPIPEYLVDLFNPQTQSRAVYEGPWVEGYQSATVPAGAAFARVALLFIQQNFGGGLVFVDEAAVVNLSAGDPGADFNFDGQIDQTDLDLLNLVVAGDLLANSTRWDLDGSGDIDAGDVAFLESLLGIGSALAGDYNGNGSVEQGDLDLVLNNWGGPRTAGFVANADGFATANVDQEELDRVLNNWGSTSGPGLSGVSVPEPATLALVGVGYAAMLRRRGA